MGRGQLLTFAWCVVVCAAAIPYSAVRAQSESSDPQPSKTEVLAGHSYHGEAFNEGPRQKAFLMGGTGKVSFPVTTEVPQVQELFNQGVGQLHGFWYFEAERTFRQAAVLDPECAMPYWGMALANFENKPRAKGFIEKARERKASASPRERMWIEGHAAYLDEESGDRKKRRREYLRSIEAIIHEYPDDPEAKAFLAVRLWQFKSDLPIPSYQAVDALLDQVFAVEPMHPAHHFRIHLWDREKPERALRSAALGGQASPSIAHMWHMPGHIFSRLHRYADAAWQQEASARVDHAQMIRDRVMPDQIHNFAHNNEWLIRNLIHVGRVRDAVDLAKNMIELPRHPTYNTLKKRGRSASYGRARLFQVLERYELWDELIALSDTIYLEPTDVPEQRIVRWRALGVAHFEKGDLLPLKRQITALRKLRGEQRTARETLVDKKTEKDKAKDEDAGSDDDEKEEKDEEEKPDTIEDIDRRLAAIKQARLELQGYKSLLEDDPEEAWEFFEEVEKLDKVRRSRLRLNAGDVNRACELALEAVDASECQVVPLANHANTLYRAEKIDDAKEAFGKLQALSARIDLDAPVFRRLQPLVKEMALPADWRVTASPSDDIGRRPPLDELGPFRWHPSSAPSWRLPAANGKTIALDDYRGRAVVVIFYLGAGCLHCVEQLHAFAPKTEAFAEAGISLIAISTENERDLRRGLSTFNDKGEFPFPLVSNWLLDVFKAYRAYDDFESQPLHGTFLIDETQRVRWQDISYEPFTHPDFMLAESKRLLRKPRSAVTLLAE